MEPQQQSGLKHKYSSLGKYLLIKTLGSGYNSKVKLGFDPTSNLYCAIKTIKHSHPSLNLKTIQKEIEVLSHLNHPNIVNLIEFHESIDYVKKNGKSYKAVAIVMELVPGGELFEYVADSGRFSEETARTYFQTLIKTLEYCYGQEITHRDLKPENLLFDANFNLKVADFGFATLLSGKDGSGQLHTILGTESYMAPEIHLRKPYVGSSVDLFASGIILFIMISGTPPFAKADPRSDPHYKLIVAGKNDVFWKAHERSKPKNFYTEDFKDLMNKMLASDPSARLAIDQIQAHPWFKGKTLDVNVLKAEFLQRKKLVDAELAKQREAKQKEKLAMKVQPQHAQGAFAGIKPFRSLEAEMETDIAKELESKINFNAKREMEEYQPQAGFKAYTEVYSVMPADFLFKLLCAQCKTHTPDFNVSEDKYKIKGKASRDEGNCSLNILLTKVDDATTCVEFHKTGGNLMTFYKVIEDIKKGIPVVVSQEEAEAEKKDAPVEGQ